MTAVVTQLNSISHEHTMVSVWEEPGEFYHIVDIDGTWLATISMGDDAFDRVIQFIEENELKVDEVSINGFEELRKFGE